MRHVGKAGDAPETISGGVRGTASSLGRTSPERQAKDTANTNEGGEGQDPMGKVVRKNWLRHWQPQDSAQQSQEAETEQGLAP